MTKAERVADRKSRRICIDCGTKEARRGRTRCKGCGRRAAASTQRWQRRNRQRDLDCRRHRMESLYWSNTDLFRNQIAERRVTKKVNGICRDCPRPSLEDNIRCHRCRDKDRKAAKARTERRQRREQAEIAAYRPLDAIIDLTRVRVLRAARHLEWFTVSQLFDVLGGGTETQRNTIAQMITRLARCGDLERQRIPALFGGYGAQWEYQITEVGISELDAILRGHRPTITSRRAV